LIIFCWTNSNCEDSRRMKLSKISSLLIRFVAAETRFFAAEIRFLASTDRSLDRTISESWTGKEELILIDFWTVFSNL
jgi:hypothetical protein